MLPHHDAPRATPPLRQPARVSGQRRQFTLVVVIGTSLLLLILILLLMSPLPPANHGAGASHEQQGAGTSDASAGPPGDVGQSGARENTSQATEESTPGEQEPAQHSPAREEAASHQQSEPERPSRGMVAERPRFVVESINPEFRDVAERLRDAGAGMGDVQISLAWNNYNDLDLHVITPSGDRISFRNRRSTDGGELDVDMNAGAHRSRKPVENVFWGADEAPRGKYTVQVNHYSNHGNPDPTPYQVIVVVDGDTKRFEGEISYGSPIQTVHQFQR